MGNIFIAMKVIFVLHVPTAGSRVERGAQIGGKGLIALRCRVRTNTTEVSTGCSMAAQLSSNLNAKLLWMFSALNSLRLDTCARPI